MEENIFTTIGFCKTLGVKKATLIGAGIGAAGGAFYAWLLNKKFPISTEKKLMYIIGGALIGGGVIGLGSYFTCKGVEYGVPISR